MSKNLNERNTYIIKTKDGKIVETARIKAQANILKHKMDSELKEETTIERVKWTNKLGKW